MLYFEFSIIDWTKLLKLRRSQKLGWGGWLGVQRGLSWEHYVANIYANCHFITLGTRFQEQAVAGTGREVPNPDERRTRGVDLWELIA